MEDNFSQLEEKVLHAVSLIKDLKAENSRLTKQRDALEEQMQAFKEERERMNRELDQARFEAATVERFEEKRRIIEEKVGGLLEKLEEIG
jgi:outer membrane murein-binding lipoprotein Lpp